MQANPKTATTSRARGSVVVRDRRTGTFYGLRFVAYGERRYVSLGSEAEGWTRERADEELALVLREVQRGTWRPPAAPVEPEIMRDPTFHEFASDWFDGKRGELRNTTVADYEWQLTSHLLPFFASHRLSEITVQEVDRFRESKVRESTLSATSINKTITRLGQILERAVEYELIGRNPARIGNRKLKAVRARPIHLDSAELISALLDAAKDLDEAKGSKTSGRRALVATLTLAGLRIGEACALLWRDVDLAHGRITVGRSKTDAGMREVDLLPLLRDELAAHKAAARAAGHDDLVFPTAAGTPRDKDNARERVIRPVVTRAEMLLAERGCPALPAGVTAHKLRHTFASVLIALGRDPAYVMGQLGHADPAFTLRIYAHAMRRGDDERDALRVLVEGRTSGHMGVQRPRSRELVGVRIVDDS